MKKLVLALLIALTLTLAVVGGFFSLRDKFLSTDNAGQTFSLLKETGSVFYKTQGDYLQATQAETALKSGTYVKTGDASVAEIILPKAVISVAENSEIQINFNENATTVVQISGSTWQRVEKLASGKIYQLETATMLARSSGTKFGADVVTGQDPQVFVLEDQLEVGLLGSNNNFAGKTELVSNGQLASISKAQNKINLVEIPSQLKTLTWYQLNLALDNAFDKDGVNGVRDLIQQRVAQSRQNVAGANTNNLAGTAFSGTLAGIKDRYGKVDNSLCTNINNSVQLQKDLDSLNNLAKTDPQINDNLDLINTLIDTAKTACSDGQINPQEADQLSQIDKQLQTFN